MQTDIDWELTSNGVFELGEEDIPCIMNDDELDFSEATGCHHLDFNKSLYTRTTNDYVMDIDFPSKVCNIRFASGEQCSIDITCDLQITPQKIAITYWIADEEKKLTIIRKE